jgi:hypothetical protein
MYVPTWMLILGAGLVLYFHQREIEKHCERIRDLLARLNRYEGRHE